jgi:hypothetical protein
VLNTLGERVGFARGLLRALSHVEPESVLTRRMLTNIERRSEHLADRIENLWQTERAPYRGLLERASWQPDRARRSIAESGPEATLESMARDGVYLSADEVRGKRPVVRSGSEIPFRAEDLESLQGPAVPLITSGTSGSRSRMPMDLAGFVLQASYLPMMLAALEADQLPVVLYYPAASTAGNAHMLSFALAGTPPTAWFCHVRTSASPLSQWRILLQGLVAAARVRGVQLPLPQLADVERPIQMIEWLQRNASSGAVISTFPGSALRVHRFARLEGLRLPAITWILGGEPISPRKRAFLEEDGARVYPWYGAVDTGRISIGCLDPASADDMHLLTDRYAAIFPLSEGGEPGERRVLLTSLIPGVHRSMLNLDLGDFAEPLRRRCGCPFEKLGFEEHIHAVHSREKVTVEGATIAAERLHLLASDLLPAACGGSPTDYQIVEEEDAAGFTRLIVLVHPSVAADEEAVRATAEKVLATAAGGATAERLARAGTIVVRREVPRLTPAGKSLAVGRSAGSRR